MLEGLQKKWKVSPLQLVLIICTFAIGGSLTGYIGRKLMNLFGIEQTWLWIIVYILVITILWPVLVMVVSLPFGQYGFFSKYLMRIGRRLGIGGQKSVLESQGSGVDSLEPLRIAVFASGAGTNAQKIIDHFRKSSLARVCLIVSNKPEAGVLGIAAMEHIPTLIIEREEFFRGHGYLDELRTSMIDFIVLAGFLWKVPTPLIRAFPGKIINIHPALLPKYGGKGMFGHHVHEAVIAAGDTETGITIHYVDEQYDHGDVIFQAKCPVLSSDNADSLAKRIHVLEHEFFPKIIEEQVRKLIG